MGFVDADVILVPEHRDGEINRLGRLGVGALPDLGFAVLDRPARIAVLLPRLGRLPVLGHPALLDRCFLRFGIALFGCRHDSGVDDLAAHGKIAPILERRIEAGEEFIYGLGIYQAFPEQPHRRRIRHSAIEPKAQEPLK